MIYAEKRKISEQSVLVGKTDAGMESTDKQLKALAAREKLTAKMTREFVVRMEDVL